MGNAVMFFKPSEITMAYVFDSWSILQFVISYLKLAIYILIFRQQMAQAPRNVFFFLEKYFLLFPAFIFSFDSKCY